VEAQGVLFEAVRFLGYRDPSFNQVFEVRNGTDNWFLYRALELSLHKGFSDNLQFLVGYSHTNQWIEGTWDRYDPASFLQPEAFPNTRGIGSVVGFVAGQTNSFDPTLSANSGVPPHV
jgi:hypothetical protein